MFREVVCGVITVFTVVGVIIFAVRGGIGFYEDYEVVRNDRIAKEVERQLQMQEENE